MTGEFENITIYLSGTVFFRLFMLLEFLIKVFPQGIWVLFVPFYTQVNQI